MTWEGFPIACIELKEESEFDDPRSIATFGILAPTLKKKAADKVWAIQQSRGHYVKLEGDEQSINPTPDTVDGVRFIRVADEPSPDDPLMDLPTCEEYEMDSRFENL